MTSPCLPMPRMRISRSTASTTMVCAPWMPPVRAWRALLTTPSPRGRWQPLRRHQRLRAPPLLSHPPRSRRSQQFICLYPRITAAPAIFRTRRWLQRFAPWCAANPPAATSRQGLCPVQLDRHLLLVARVEPRVWRHPGQELQLDRRCRLERRRRCRRREAGRRHHPPVPEPPDTGGQDRRR